MTNKLLCCCCICGNEITTNSLSIHYKSKQCLSGELFSQKIKRIASRSLKCTFCDFVGKNTNSISQHELICKFNPNKKYKKPSYGMKGKTNGEGSNQYKKARQLGLPVPKMNDDVRKKLQQGWRLAPKSYSSKQGTQAIQKLLNLLIDINYGKVYHAGIGREFWLTENREKYYFYDCCFKDLMLIVEFQGTAYHPKSLLEEFRVPYKNMGTQEDCWNKDRLKEKLAINNGFTVEYIWSDNINDDIEKIVLIIRKKLKVIL